MKGRQRKLQQKKNNNNNRIKIKKCFIYEHWRKIKKITIKKINKK
jgi:hypothetical protein